MKTQTNNHVAKNLQHQISSWAASASELEPYRFTKVPETPLERANILRSLQADAFALSNRAMMDWFGYTNYTNKEKADEMNKLGMRARNGDLWTARSIRKLIMRLDVISEFALKIEVNRQTTGNVRTKQKVLDDLSFDLFAFLIEEKGTSSDSYFFCTFPDLT